MPVGAVAARSYWARFAGYVDGVSAVETPPWGDPAFAEAYELPDRAGTSLLGRGFAWARDWLDSERRYWNRRTRGVSSETTVTTYAGPTIQLRMGVVSQAPSAMSDSHVKTYIARSARPSCGIGAVRRGGRGSFPRCQSRRTRTSQRIVHVSASPATPSSVRRTMPSNMP